MQNKSLILIIVLLALGAAAWMLYDNRTVDRIPTSADNAPPGSIHNLPVPEAVAKVRAQAARDAGVSEGLVIVQTALEKEWPDGCLGLMLPDEKCIQVITPGYEVVVEAGGRTFTYRTNQDGSHIRKE